MDRVINYKLTIQNTILLTQRIQRQSDKMHKIQQSNEVLQQQSSNKGYQFLSNIHSKHLNCKICSKLMLQPIRLHRCGHTFCQSCVSGKLVKECPLCLQKIEKRQKDILAIKLIGQLGVRCLNSGCPWKGSLEQFNNFHKNSCSLKQGGMQAWLNQLKNTLKQNSVSYGGLNQNKQNNSIQKLKQARQSQQNDNEGQKQNNQSNNIDSRQKQKQNQSCSNKNEAKKSTEEQIKQSKHIDTDNIQNQMFQKRIKKVQQ